MSEEQRGTVETVQTETADVAETVQDKSPQADEGQSKKSGGSAFESIYEQLPDISVQSVDRFIVLCVIALLAVILIGVLKANHVF